MYNKNVFSEFESALVLDVILDSTHEIFNREKIGIESNYWPPDISDSKPNSDDPDYTWIGRALIRRVNTQKNIEKENLTWALPLQNNISEYPLLNEIVLVTECMGQTFYTKKANIKNFVNSNADFNLEILYGGYEKKDGAQFISSGNRELNFDRSDIKTYSGPLSKLNYNGSFGYMGVLGRYFVFNKNIRSIKQFEGDLTIESRFGQSIRFSSYDANRMNDKGYNSEFGGYKDYKGTGTINPFSSEEAGGGNPMILIRNRQRPIVNTGDVLKLHEKLPAITGLITEKNVGGYIEEDINNDGSSIHITSGVTTSKFVTSCYKSIFQQGLEEQSDYSPIGCTLFKFPILNGDQIVINTDRLIFSSRFKETLHFSKKRYSIVTDDEYTVDAHNQIVFTTNNKTVINSPAIYLGEYGITDEPALLGQTTINWLYTLCDWLLQHTHWYKHSHPKTGLPSPDKTQIPVEIQSLIQLRDSLHTLLSRRVFLTGGGFAEGKNGGVIKDGMPPVNINVNNGDGVPGGWKAQNKRPK